MPNKQLLQSAGDGTAVPQGYVGERLVATGAETGLLAGTTTTNLGLGITLTPGVWMAQANGVGSAVAPTRVSVSLTNSTNAVISDSDGYNWSGDVFQPSGGSQAMNVNTGFYYFKVPSGSTQIVKARAVVTWPSNGGTTTVTVQAIRIA
jgi:hypothetical protein